MSNHNQVAEPTNHVSAVDNAPSMNDNLAGLSGLDSTGNLGPMAFESVFPEFFEHIMMPFDGSGSADHVVRPPDVSNYTQDLNFGAADLDFSFLDNQPPGRRCPFKKCMRRYPNPSRPTQVELQAPKLVRDPKHSSAPPGLGIAGYPLVELALSQSMPS